MNRRLGTRERATRRPVIVLAGESSGDRKVMRTFIEALCGSAQGRIVEINDIVRLCKADERSLRQRAIKLAGSARARGAREEASVQCVFIHEDFDETDSEHRAKVRRRVQEALDREMARAFYVLAAWEVEAWLLMFPDAISDFATSWKVPARYVGVDTGLIADPKRVMKKEVARSSPEYRESDAPAIAEKITALGLHRSPAGRNSSYDEFKASVSDCCGSM